jgi:hypothetical protein
VHLRVGEMGRNSTCGSTKLGIRSVKPGFWPVFCTVFAVQVEILYGKCRSTPCSGAGTCGEADPLRGFGSWFRSFRCGEGWAVGSGASLLSVGEHLIIMVTVCALSDVILEGAGQDAGLLSVLPVGPGAGWGRRGGRLPAGLPGGAKCLPRPGPLTRCHFLRNVQVTP